MNGHEDDNVDVRINRKENSEEENSEVQEEFSNILTLKEKYAEPKSLVTVGQTSDIDRDEALSEINLNSNLDETQSPALIDTNSNSLLEQNPNTDSILSQAASSFSALPSVASSVFSTFSKRIYSTASSQERTPFSEETDANTNPISELDIQPPYTQHHQQQHQFYGAPQEQFNTPPELSASLVPPPFAGGNNNVGAPSGALTSYPPPPQSQLQNNEPPPEPPKLYTPAEVPTLNAASVSAPPPAGGQNTYRLAAKKKIYAPIPGFSSDTTNQQQAAPILDPSAISAQTQAIPYGFPQSDLYGPTQSQQQPQQHQPFQSKPEERKGGIFSITNLVPTGVLQNISGLVQSAAGTIAQTVKPDSTYQSPFSSQQQQQQQQHQEQTSFDVSQGSNFYPCQPNQPIASTQNFFATPYPTEAQQVQVGLPPLPTQTNFFVPTSDQTFTENPVEPVSTQLGFDQFLSDPNPANSPTAPEAARIAVAEPEPQDSNLLNTTEIHTESQPVDSTPLLAPPTQAAEPSEAESGSSSTISAALITTGSASTHTSPIESLSASVPKAVVPTQIQFFDPIRPPSQPTPSNLYYPIRPPSQPFPGGPTNLTQNTFFDPIRPPSQPVPAASSILTPNTFFAPIRPPSQPAPAALTNLTPNSYFDPIRPPSQPVSVATTNLTANTFFVPIRPPSQPASAGALNLTPNTFFAPIRPPTQPVSAATTNLIPNNILYPIRPPSQPAPAATTYLTPAPSQSPPASLTPTNFFDPTRPLAQTSATEVVQQASYPNQPLVPQIPTATQSNISNPAALLTQLPLTSVGQPPAASGPSSFRLQKGTRLYKNPLTSAETVSATYLNQPLQQPSLVQPQSAAHITPQSIFNPFASTIASVEQSPALFVPETLPARELKEDHPADKQTPALFVPETLPQTELKEVPKPDKPQPIGFFNPNSATSSDFIAQPTFTPNTELKEKPTEPLLTFPNQLLQQELNVLQPSDQFIPHSEKAQSAQESEAISNASVLETNSEPSTAEVVSNTKAANINDNAAASIHHPEQNLIGNPDEQQSTDEKQSIPFNQTVWKPAQEKAAELNDSLTAFQAANFLPPPPQLTALQGIANPYRKEHTTTHSTTIASPTTGGGTQPSLANFFTPIGSDCSTDFNFFSTPSKPTESSDSFSSTSALFNDPKEISENTITTTTNFFQLETPNAPTPSPQPTPTPSPKPATTPTPAPTANTNADPCVFPQLPPQTCIAPPPLFKEPPKDLVESSSLQHPAIAPPLGFDNLIATANNSLAQTTGNVTEFQSQAPTTQQAPNFHSVSNFFNKTSDFPNCETNITTAKEAERTLPDPTSFFDSFAPPSTVTTAISQPLPVSIANPSQTTKQQQTNEDQRIQNFFNNPPPQELGGSIGDLNYDLVHGGLAVKNLQTRSLTPASILVEPPSSSCSEFSELNSSLFGQRQNISAESSNKISPEEEIKTQPTVEAETATVNENKSTVVTENDLTKHYEDLPGEILQELRMANLLTGEKGAASAPPTTISTYSPAVKHWFFKRIISNKTYWTPFSHYDSALLETTLVMGENAPNMVAVEGGRYDVNIKERTKTPVYWEGKPIEVKRCSWFYKATDSRYVPYEEETAERLEAEYKLASEKGEWHKKIIISMGEQVVFHGPTVIVHFQQQQNIDAWGGSSQTTTRPRVVKRDLEDFAIEQGESQRVDHLLLMVHGIGSACDLKMRSVEEVVDEFRTIAQQLVSSHYKNSTEMGLVGRVEILPISWHSHLHSAEMGIDEKLKSITLESIPKLRNFANDTLLDVLFYTSPTYCQMIMNTVASSMNLAYAKYRQRHPEFSGGVSVAGHSLGSLILFDMLCHQYPIKEIEEGNMENPDQNFAASPSYQFPTTSNSEQNPAKQTSYTMGTAGTGQPFINYEQLLFQPKKFFAMGSPIGVFVTVRGIDNLGLDFRLPTCSGFYNIFHPFDPVAYRIEALVNPDMNGIRPVLIPHHKGRKRMHLELRETMTRVGADLKQRFMDTFKNTLETVNFLGSTSTSRGNKENEAKETMEKEVDKVLKMQLHLDQPDEETLLTDEQKTLSQTRMRTDSASTSFSDTDIVEIDLPLGKLNDSKRIDYVLQEAPLEFFNEYLFALSSHVCYWESEDTILFVMKEIYTGLGVSPDSQVPQQSMTIERPSTRNSQNTDSAQDQVATPT